MVLLKGLDERGFIFYTNYDSRKGRELVRCCVLLSFSLSPVYFSHLFLQTENPQASLMFYWDVVKRQVSALRNTYLSLPKTRASLSLSPDLQIRIEGQVERLPAEESDRYFKSRPIDSQVSAACSEQSCSLKDRQVSEPSLIRLHLVREGVGVA